MIIVLTLLAMSCLGTAVCCIIQAYQIYQLNKESIETKRQLQQMKLPQFEIRTSPAYVSVNGKLFRTRFYHTCTNV